MTADELLAMPDDGNCYELLRGELRMMSPAGGRHGMLASKLARRIGNFVEQHGLGLTYAAETGFLLELNPDTVRAPDVAFVSHQRLGKFADFSGFLPLAPDLVAEVVSPSDRPADIEEKALEWLAAGVTIVLIVDPPTKTIRDYRAGQAAHLYDQGSIDLDAVIPGFRLDVPELFS